jgi:hypothetical protein
VVHVCQSWFAVLICFPGFQSLATHPAGIGFLSSAIVLVHQTRDPRFIFAQVSHSSAVLLRQVAAPVSHPTGCQIKVSVFLHRSIPCSRTVPPAAFRLLPGHIFLAGARQGRTCSPFAVVQVRCLILAGSSTSVFPAREKLPLSRSFACTKFVLCCLRCSLRPARPGALVPFPLLVASVCSSQFSVELAVQAAGLDFASHFCAVGFDSVEKRPRRSNFSFSVVVSAVDDNHRVLSAVSDFRFQYSFLCESLQEEGGVILELPDHKARGFLVLIALK